MLDKIKFFVEFAKHNKMTTICALSWGIISLITSNPSAIAFIGPSAAALVLQVSMFLKDAVLAIGLLFAADSKMPSLDKFVEKQEEKEEIKEEQKFIEVAERVKKKVAKKAPVKKSPTKSKTK